MDFRHKAVCPPPPPRRDSWGLPEPVGYNNEVASPYFPPSAPPPPPPRGGDFGLPDFSHGTRGLGDFLHNRIHEAETRVTRYSQQPAVHEAVATFSPTDRLQKPRPGAGAGAASGGGAAGGIVAELTGDGRFSSGHQLNAGAPAFHPRQHQTPQQTFEFEGVANPDDDDWVKNPDIRSYWTAPDAKQGSSVRQVPVPTASSGRYAGIAAELTSDGRLDPEPWQGNYPASVPVGKGLPKPGTPGNDWRREWRGEEPSRLKSAEEHWNPRSLNGSSKGKGKGKKGGKDAVGPEWYGWSKGTHEAMAEEQRTSALQMQLARQSPSGVLANLRARRLGLPLPFAAAAPLRADVGWPWRMDWGGHDPASPVAEMHINYHNTGWGIMIFDAEEEWEEGRRNEVHKQRQTEAKLTTSLGVQSVELKNLGRIKIPAEQVFLKDLTMADEKRSPSALQMQLARQSPSGLLANIRARRLGLPLPFAAVAPMRADVGWPWRMDWGGHDPASPVAEMHINYHNTGWGIMIFVCTSVLYLMTKR
ncbi:unnamed protein product [Symbiodinium microadriaticum]|nr:unnamed protein product [Symbiodinium microadriaticum]